MDNQMRAVAAMAGLNNIIIINGIETTVTASEYIKYLRDHHKPITEEIMEMVVEEEGM